MGDRHPWLMALVYVFIVATFATHTAVTAMDPGRVRRRYSDLKARRVPCVAGLSVSADQ